VLPVWWAVLGAMVFRIISGSVAVVYCVFSCVVGLGWVFVQFYVFCGWCWVGVFVGCLCWGLVATWCGGFVFLGWYCLLGLVCWLDYYRFRCFCWCEHWLFDGGVVASGLVCLILHDLIVVITLWWGCFVFVESFGWRFLFVRVSVSV